MFVNWLPVLPSSMTASRSRLWSKFCVLDYIQISVSMHVPLSFLLSSNYGKIRLLRHQLDKEKICVHDKWKTSSGGRRKKRKNVLSWPRLVRLRQRKAMVTYNPTINLFFVLHAMWFETFLVEGSYYLLSLKMCLTWLPIDRFTVYARYK